MEGAVSIGKVLGRAWIVLSVAALVVCGGGDGGNSKAEGGSSKAAGSGKGGSFTDPRDKQEYRTVKIGNQVWMAQNLNFEIENSWCYGDFKSDCEKYGRLYSWEAAKRACPNGWHLPSREEWNSMVDAAGGSSAGKNLKSKTGWNGTDEFGFSALPGGNRYHDGSFNHVGDLGRWWSATEYGSGSAYAYGRLMYSGDVYEGEDDSYKSYKGNGFSVRCAQD
jgi:uncharacterized protein (TIGR02145 family)